MLSFIKKFFGTKSTASTPEVPYKVESPTTVGSVPMSTQYTHQPVVEIPKKKPAAKKPAGEKKPVVRAKTPRTKKK